ncbi:DUF2802 domain-containing protein [Laribacter hongkongensis]|uniref:DUF2802 domain-containing protein n=1 Tax=Laribacter hongkongensis TaxID=168471 RepID=UPI001EFDBC2C|nr:DUF2802 domain-containing protein [Laribacter hongkongensis]MCG9084221.1 DUF2802 domain-containing protein [Laribacter hongkongensis]
MWWIVLAGMTALAVTACFVWFFMILSQLMLRVERLGQSLDLLKADSIQLRQKRDVLFEGAASELVMAFPAVNDVASPYRQALVMLQRGEAISGVAQQCGLSRSEVELLRTICQRMG